MCWIEVVLYGYERGADGVFGGGWIDSSRISLLTCFTSEARIQARRAVKTLPKNDENQKTISTTTR